MQNHQKFSFRDHPTFSFYLVSRFMITIALQLQAVVIGWQIYQFTKDPMGLAYMGLSEAVPAITVALWSGVLADRINRKKLVAVSLSVVILSVAGLVFFSKNIVEFYPHTGALPFYLVLFLNGLARGVFAPAASALLGDIIPSEKMLKASTWNTTIWQIAAIAGPVIGGWSYVWFGATNSYILELILILISFVLFLQINVHERHVQNYVHEKFLVKLKEGILFVKNDKVLLGAMSLDMLAVLFGGAVSLLPIFASDILNVGPQGLGLLRTAPAIGSASMSLLMLALPPITKAGIILISVVFGFGLSIMCFALSKTLYLSLICLFMSGVFDTVSVVIRSTIMQLRTPSELKGRVSAVNSIFIGSSNEIGAFESGLAAKLLGVVPSVIFGSGMTLLIALGANFLVKPLRNFEFKSKS